MTSPIGERFLADEHQRAQLGRAALELAASRDALAEAADFVRTEAPVPPRAGIDRPSDDEAMEVAYEIARQLAPGASERDRERRLPGPELDPLSSSGLLAVTVPRSHGGADVSFETVGRIFQILSTADPAIGQLPQNH